MTLGVLLAVLAPTFVRADKYKKGAVVRIEGRVVNVTGDGVPGATVELSASREALRINPLRRGDQGPVTTRTVSGEGGRYAFDWVWDRYHDTFELEVVLAAAGDGEREVLGSRDISELLVGDSPVTVDLEVVGASMIRFAERARRGWSAEEQRVLDELGRPERYETQEHDGMVEESWWYFAHGKMYRFAGGALLQVVHFDPLAADGATG